MLMFRRTPFRCRGCQSRFFRRVADEDTASQEKTSEVN
jgi:hypothetical protein